MGIAIAVAVFLLGCAMAYLGVHVTLHPAETPRSKLVYKILFIGVAIVTGVLVGWQAYRADESDRELRAEIGTLQNGMQRLVHNTEQPPHITIEQKTDPQSAQAREAAARRAAADKAKWEQVGRFLGEGEAIKRNALRGTLKHEAIQGWKLRVSKYLRSNLGVSYQMRFMNPVGRLSLYLNDDNGTPVSAEQTKLWNTLNQYTSMLSDFLSERR